MMHLNKNGKNAMLRETTSLFLLKWVLYLYFILFFLLYPFYYENKYYNMGDAKWNFFRSITYYIGDPDGGIVLPSLLTLAVLFFLWYLIHLTRKGQFKSYLQGFLRGNMTDYFVAAYAVLITISTILSPYKDVVITGYSGWYMGYMAQISFVLLYLFYRNFHEDMKVIYGCALVVAGVIMSIAVLNRFGFDPLGMFDGMMPHKASEAALGGFLSTLGQTTWYGSYVSLITPFGFYLYWKSDDRRVRIATGIFTFLAGMTICTTRADSLYMAVIAVAYVLFFTSVFQRDGDAVLKDTTRFLELVVLILLAFKAVGILQDLFPDQAVILDKIPIFLSHSVWMYIPTIGAVLALVLLRVMGQQGEKKALTLEAKEARKKRILRNAKIVGILVLLISLAIFCGILGYIIYNSNPDLPEEQRNLSNYLLFNNYWGHYRGISWRYTYRTFMASIQDNPLQFLFGTGPDAFYKAVYEPNKEAFAYFFDQAVLTNGHNEWMTIFINTGLLGGVAYWGIFISAFVTFFRSHKTWKAATAVATAIAAYVAYNTFCYQQIICTPMIFMIMGCGMWHLRKTQGDTAASEA